MNRIVILGSMNMDLCTELKSVPKIGETILGDNFSCSIGGKGANQAVASARMGSDTVFLGKTGEDDFGKRIISTLHKEGINVEHIEREEDIPTGMANVFRIANDNCIVVNTGANQKVDADYIIRHKDVLENTDVVLAQLEVPTKSVLELFKIAKEKHIKTILNPAPFREDMFELLEYVDIMTPNKTEFIDICQYNEIEVSDIQKSLQEWDRRFPNVQAIVTLGAEGVAWIENGNTRLLSAEKVQAIDTTGAGDTFNGILASSLSLGNQLEESIRLASRGASISVTKKGAQAGIPYKEDI
ncbi:MAG: ribokinase [Lachnospiraceae bacterium]|nr:ribokinase [Lachnospiraceae bacterium]